MSKWVRVTVWVERPFVDSILHSPGVMDWEIDPNEQEGDDND